MRNDLLWVQDGHGSAHAPQYLESLARMGNTENIELVPERSPDHIPTSPKVRALIPRHGYDQLGVFPNDDAVVRLVGVR